MESFGQNNTDLLKLKAENSPDCDPNYEVDNLPVCAYCGFEEKFLGNQFVKVRTSLILMLYLYLFKLFIVSIV
jgi:hypothetical protein